jgi:hypothetical protein
LDDLTVFLVHVLAADRGGGVAAATVEADRGMSDDETLKLFNEKARAEQRASLTAAVVAQAAIEAAKKDPDIYLFRRRTYSLE